MKLNESTVQNFERQKTWQQVKHSELHSALLKASKREPLIVLDFLQRGLLDTASRLPNHGNQLTGKHGNTLLSLINHRTPQGTSLYGANTALGEQGGLAAETLYQ